MGVVLPLIQRKQVMLGVFSCDDLPEGWHTKHGIYAHPLGHTPSLSLTLVQEEALSIWN